MKSVVNGDRVPWEEDKYRKIFSEINEGMSGALATAEGKRSGNSIFSHNSTNLAKKNHP